MHRVRLYRDVLITSIALATVLAHCPALACQAAQPPDPEQLLSPYWTNAVHQWESIIVEYSLMRGYDPDLIAAVIWKESLGRANARGPGGSVGLMQVMPKEAGFSWRPTARELEQPWFNVFWGTRTLSNVINQANGDLYNALAAYNGGWERAHSRAPRRYAEDVLGHYARAVAMRCGLPPEGHWVATFASMNEDGPIVLTVLGPQRAMSRYSAWPVTAYIPDATTDGPPTVVVFAPSEGPDAGCRVGLWITWDGQVVHEPAQQPERSYSHRMSLTAPGRARPLWITRQPDT